MTKKSPEEYFSQQSFSAEGRSGGGEFTPAERAFMQKYLGLDEADILRKIGITPPSAPAAVPPAAAPAAAPPAAAPPAAAPPVAAQPAAAPQSMPAAVEAKPESAAMPEAAPAESEAKASSVPASAPGVRAAEAPAPAAVPIPDPVPAPAPQPALQPAPAPAPQPAPAAEPEEPSLESIMRKAEEQQLVAFYLGEQEFVLPIIAVQEVIKAVPHTRVPSAPPLIAGVINLRGRVTPLLQLRELLGVPRTGKQDDGFIIVCRRRGIQMGLIIDRVHTMYRVVQKDVDWAVETHLGNVEIVCGLLKADDRLLGIISVDKIFSMLLEA